MAYFELNDIKRDRPLYDSDALWHLPYWSPLISNNLVQNTKIAAWGCGGAAFLVETGNHYWHSMKTLNLAYEWPKKTADWSIFLRESFKIPHFWSQWRKKVVYGAIQSIVDFGSRFASIHYFWGGTWSPIGHCDMHSLKFIFYSYFSAYAICWTGIPFDIARKAYFADQSWPAELRKGYRSPLHALAKIPFTEGPLYLWKGGLPTYLGNAQFTGSVFWAYTWLKNKAFFLWVYNDINYSWVKFNILNFSMACGAFFGYPFYYMQEMMEIWPKERGGKCTFNGSYLNALKWYRSFHDIYQVNMMEFYWNWFRRRGVIFYLAMWEADNMGLFTNNLSDVNTIDNICAEEESD